MQAFENSQALMALARLKGQQEGQKSSNQGCKKCGQMGHLSVLNMPQEASLKRSFFHSSRNRR
jgi:hypothetical protein